MDKSGSEDEYIGLEAFPDDTVQSFFSFSLRKKRQDKSVIYKKLWKSNPAIYLLLRLSKNLETARDDLYKYLNMCEREIDLKDKLHPLERINAKQCISVFRNIIAPINEKRVNSSALKILWALATKSAHSQKVSNGFIFEFIYLFRGLIGKSGIYSQPDRQNPSIPEFVFQKGRKAAQGRSTNLDQCSANMITQIDRFRSGLESELVFIREKNRHAILEYFDATITEWNNWIWQLSHVFRNNSDLYELIELRADEQEAIRLAVENHIPFGITPYYLSLMSLNGDHTWDYALRNQVIPPLNYIKTMIKHRENLEFEMDFMGEHDTSPIDLITRRYPQIVILKPYNTCSQICVYCQRNWEINEVLSPRALAKKEQIEKAIEWIVEHPQISEVLVTGGDPVVLPTQKLSEILKELATIDHIERIRIGSRTPVVLPMRFIDDELLSLFNQIHQPGKREFVFVTHFQHATECTPEAMAAIQNIHCQGINVYNQHVYTFHTSRRFETVSLRKNLRLIGVDPYYTFNTKGKEETSDYRVPIARILQERKEEARLLPGIVRTDEPVFNVPRLGKNHLRAGQDHQLIMILPDGRRVYEFHPWEKNLTAMLPYIYKDISIYEYLKRLYQLGEDVSEYRTIWYYY